MSAAPIVLASETSGGLAVRAAVVRSAGAPFTIEDLHLDPPRETEVLVRIVSAGVCHTDAVVRAGLFPSPMPLVLGHEGAGVVEQVGSAVTKVKPGDHVVLTFDSCGRCSECVDAHPASCRQALALNFGGARGDGSHALHSPDGVVNDRFFGQSSFATYAVATERNVVPVRRDVPLHLLSALACGIQTGAGAVLNSLAIKAGQTIAVFGVGGVGLSAIMAAKLSGAARIIAVDIRASRLDQARDLGATECVDSSIDDAGEVIRAIAPEGLHFAVDTTGLPGVIQTAIDVIGPRGECCLLGTSSWGATLPLDLLPFLGASKRIRGVIAGDSNPDIFIPRMIELFLSGVFPFDRLVTFYPLEDIERAFADADSGISVKPVLLTGPIEDRP